jgi:hypothetical protein
MRERGYYAETVERWIPRLNIRKDFAGVIDVLCLGDNEIVGVQTTSASNVSARVRKIANAETLPHLRRAGVRILVHGWRKSGRTWVLREVDCS